METTAALNPQACQPKNQTQADFLNWFGTFFLGAEGGWGSGKTWCGARKLVALHIYNAVDALGNKTFCPSCVLGPTYKLLDEINIPEIKRALDDFGLAYKFQQQKKKYILPQLSDGEHLSEITFYTADEPGKITGWEVGAAWGDEATRW